MSRLLHIIPIVCVFAAILLSPPIDGYSTHYAPSLFERVARARGLPAADCYIASDWHPIGSRVLVEGSRTGVRRVCQVADVSAPGDRMRHMRDGLFELDARSAQRVCGAVFAGPWRQCPIVVRAVGVYQVRGMRHL